MIIFKWKYAITILFMYFPQKMLVHHIKDIMYNWNKLYPNSGNISMSKIVALSICSIFMSCKLVSLIEIFCLSKTKVKVKPLKSRLPTFNQSLCCLFGCIFLSEGFFVLISPLYSKILIHFKYIEWFWKSARFITLNTKELEDFTLIVFVWLHALLKWKLHTTIMIFLFNS